MGKRILKGLANWDLFISGVMLCALVVCTFAGAISRYFLGAPLNWLEEIQLLCQVWIVFCGGCAAFRIGGHVMVEFVAESLPEIGQKIVLGINSIVVISVLGYLGINAAKYLQVFINSGRVTNVLHMSYVVLYGIAPLSIALMILNYILSLKKQWKEIEKECEETRQKKISAGKEGQK